MGRAGRERAIGSGLRLPCFHRTGLQRGDLGVELLDRTTHAKTSVGDGDIQPTPLADDLGDGVDDLLAHLAAGAPEGPWMFPEDQISDMPERLLAAEITREKLYLQLRQELPYAATVETETWTEMDDGSARIEQVIYVQRGTQKAIVLGKKGARIKSIGADSRLELEELLDRRVHLFLFVKVREKWGVDPERYRDWGLDYNA